MLLRQIAKYGDRALIHHHVSGLWQVASWNDARRDVLAVASGLIEAGVKPGDCVVLVGENSYEWIYCDFGIQAAGAVTVPIYANSTPEIAGKIIENSGATFAIASNQEMAAKLGSMKSVALMGKEVAEWVGREPSRVADVASRMAAIQPDDLCTIVYTSGTTGDPKGVELMHRNLVDISRGAIEVHPLTDADELLSWLPYAHVYGRINEIFVDLVFGGQIWISSGPDHLVQELQEVKPTLMCSAPRVYEKMYAAVMARARETGGVQQRIFEWAVRVGARFAQASSPGPLLRAQHRLAERVILTSTRTRLTGGRLRFFISGGAALAREIEEFFWAIGVPILNGWGMTETSSGAVSNTLHVHRFLTVGKPLPGVEVKIASDGEILVKGPGNMRGYHKNQAATEEMQKDGWVYSGDIGELDADGFLKITDRKKSLFKTSGGKYIAPLPIEHGIMANPLVERVVVIGEGRPYVTALVVPDWAGAKKHGLDRDAVNASIQKTVDHVNSTLGQWETVKYFTLLDHDFTEAAGELSLKMDVKRKPVMEHYREQIEAMYTGKQKPS
ncbi:MAG TPA: long-chain fatty acid--CoA ligase [Candidatus Dormibacteraeota bacterium]|nr:long-chain fatty acid--CoA ligase [Candidatus Dormibacteraeota bacterium]